MKYFITSFFLFFILSNSFCQSNGNALIPTERHSFASQILGEERTIQVYLPPSYYFSDKGNFPVIYLMDGDYNFHHDSGLIEFLSNVANKIPEMILIGISDKGSTKYRDYCRPNTASPQGGNANKFMSFLEKELKQFVNKKYRTSDYDILVGHSMGGLFVANHFLEQPERFDNFIAIDPSLWWNDYAVTEKADSIFQKQKELKSNLFISLADTQGMGVRGFVGILDKYFPSNPKWNFKYYENENHGSVHMITIQDALLKLFKDWNVSQEEFYSFKSAQDLIDHFKKLKTEFNTNFSLPAYNFSNMMYFYYRRNLTADINLLETEIGTHFPSSLEEFYIQLARCQMEEKKYDEAEKTYNKCLTKEPNSYRAYEGLSKIYLERKEIKKAKKASQHCLELAKKANLRQYQINELQSTFESINKN